MLSKVQRNLAYKSRQERRQLLFRLNRSVHAQLNRQNQNSFIAEIEGQKNTISKVEETPFQQTTVLNIMTSQPIKQENLDGLITFMEDCNWIGQYKAVIGLNNLGSSFINHENQVEILSKGIVPKLVELLKRSDHPFLQSKALGVLSKIVLNLTRDSFVVFLTEDIVPCYILTNCLESQSGIVVEATLGLMTKLARKKYKIINDDRNIGLIDTLEHILMNLTSNGQKLHTLIGFIVTIQPKLKQDSIQFDEKLFELMSNAIDAEINCETPSEVLRRIMFWLSDGRFVRKLCKQLSSGLVVGREKYPKMVSIIQKVYYLDLNLTCLEPIWWKYFVSYLSFNKEGMRILYQFNIIDRIQQQIKSQNLKIASVAVETLAPIIENSHQMMAIILNKASIFASIKRLYTTNDKGIIKILSNLIFIMLKSTSKQCNFISILNHFNIFRNFMMRIGQGNVTQQKRALLDLKCQLTRLSNIPNIRHQYQALKEIIVEAEVQQYLTSVIDRNYLENMQELNTYFRSLANRVREPQRFDSGVIVVDDISPFGQFQGPFLFATPILRFF